MKKNCHVSVITSISWKWDKCHVSDFVSRKIKWRILIRRLKYLQSF